MPGFNGTGPAGQGPATGRGLGPCGEGMGWRRGCGYGSGRPRGYGGRGYGVRGYGLYQPRVTEKEEVEMLTDEAGGLEEELRSIKERLTELKGKK